MTLSLLLRRASVLCAALLIASAAAAQGGAKKVLRYAFPIAETGFDTVREFWKYVDIDSAEFARRHPK